MNSALQLHQLRNSKSVLRRTLSRCENSLSIRRTNASAYFSAHNLANVKVIDESDVNVLDVVKLQHTCHH